MSSNSIGILGGTFNPIHNQHVRLAKSAYEQLALSKVMLMPSGVSYLKKDMDVLPADKRYEMCNLAAEEEPFLEVSDIEIRRTGNTYTCDTIRELLEADPHSTYYFIIGADTLFMLDKWREPGYIFGHCVIAVAARKGDADHSETGLIRKIREYEGRYNAAIRIIDISISDLSSSMIREMAGNGKDIRPYVPEKVAEYIIKNGLYR
ncbi:MAG: nicotinate-nucleotide adenylyltransferase [Lachnospiraceae bacterium]|nr:nicotinate-nucleotide adenylyltransferase [Lachnospiraceae bacterium]